VVLPTIGAPILFYPGDFARSKSFGIKPVSVIHLLDNLGQGETLICFVWIGTSTDGNDVCVFGWVLSRLLLGTYNSVIHDINLSTN
jgi:hypothetical protein